MLVLVLVWKPYGSLPSSTLMAKQQAASRAPSLECQLFVWNSGGQYTRRSPSSKAGPSYPSLRSLRHYSTVFHLATEEHFLTSPFVTGTGMSLSSPLSHHRSPHLGTSEAAHPEGPGYEELTKGMLELTSRAFVEGLRMIRNR